MINNQTLLFSRLELALIHAVEDRQLAANLARVIGRGNVRCSFSYVTINQQSSLDEVFAACRGCDRSIVLITPYSFRLNVMAQLHVSRPDIPIAYRVLPSNPYVPSNLKAVVWAELTDSSWNLEPVWRSLGQSAQTKARMNAGDWSRGVSRIFWTTATILSAPISIIAGVIGFGAIYASVASASYQDTAQFFGLLFAVPGAILIGVVALVGVLLGGQAIAKFIQATAYTYWCNSWRR